MKKTILKYLGLWLLGFSFTILMCFIGSRLLITSDQLEQKSATECVYLAENASLVIYLIFQVIFTIINYKGVASDHKQEVIKKGFRKFIIIFFLILFILGAIMFGYLRKTDQSKIDSYERTVSVGKWAFENPYYSEMIKERELVEENMNFILLIPLTPIISMIAVLLLNAADIEKNKVNTKEKEEKNEGRN